MLGLIIRVITVEETQPIWPRYLSVTDGGKDNVSVAITHSALCASRDESGSAQIGTEF